MTTPRVLLVDPDPDHVTRLKKRLETNGYTVDVAFDGEEGFRKVHHALPDAIVLETMLPKASGFKIARLIHYDRRLAHIPILFLSARDSEEDRRLARYAGATDYLKKPVELDRLFGALKTHITPRSAGKREAS